MAYQRTFITDFSVGEIGKKFYGRFDLDIYSKGVARLANWVPFRQGGITTRPPLKHLGESLGNVRAVYIPFSVGDNHFEIELTANNLRVWKDEQLLIIAPTDPIPTDYTEDELLFIHYQKVGNQLYFTNINHPPMVLTWEGQYSGMQERFNFEELDIEFGTDVQAWKPSTAYAEEDVALVTGGSLPPRIYKCITAGTSGSVGPLLEESDVLDGTVHWSWEFTKPFSQEGDYPATLAYFNGRMWFGGGIRHPDTIYASMPYAFGSFDFFSMYTYTTVNVKDWRLWASPSVPETVTTIHRKTVIGEGNAIMFQLSSANDETIMWKAATDHMVVGTGTSEWVITKEINALNVEQCVHLRSSLGSYEQQPMVLDHKPVFMQGTLTKAILWDYSYNTQDAEVDSTDLTFLADHMLEHGVFQVDFASMPEPVWLGVTNGKLACLLLSKKYKIAAWYWLETEGAVQSVCVSPGDTDDVVYLQVYRNGRYCFERLMGLWQTGIPILDSYVIVASATAVTTGLERFNGQIVQIYDAATEEWHTGLVSGGSLDTSAYAGDQLWIGLGFTCEMQTLPLSLVDAETGQSSQGKLKRIHAITARVIDSMPFKVGYSSTENLEYAKTAQGVIWTANYSGDVRIPFQGTWSTEGYVWIVQDKPQKTTVLALMPEADS